MKLKPSSAPYAGSSRPRSGRQFASSAIWSRQYYPRSLSDLGNRSENSAGRGQILSILQGNSCSIDQKSGGIWTVQTDLQPIYPKSDRLLTELCIFINEISHFLSFLRVPPLMGYTALHQGDHLLVRKNFFRLDSHEQEIQRIL